MMERNTLERIRRISVDELQEFVDKDICDMRFCKALVNIMLGSAHPDFIFSNNDPRIVNPLKLSEIAAFPSKNPDSGVLRIIISSPEDYFSRDYENRFEKKILGQITRAKLEIWPHSLRYKYSEKPEEWWKVFYGDRPMGGVDLTASSGDLAERDSTRKGSLKIESPQIKIIIPGEEMQEYGYLFEHPQDYDDWLWESVVPSTRREIKSIPLELFDK
jgi:hypothetical protein